ncbi:MAG: TolC family protein [Mucinivorans sp.]
MKHKILILAAIGVLGSTIGVAQERMTAEKYRQMVANYSLQLKMSHEKTLGSIDRMKATKTGYYPSLALAANASHTLGNDISLGDMHLKEFNYSGNLTLQQNIYAGGAVRNQTRAAVIEADIAHISEKDALQNIIYQADLIYLGSVAAYEQLRVMDNFVDIVSNLCGVVENRFKDGYVSRTDLLMVQTRLNEAKINQIAARKLYQNNMQKFNTELGVDPMTVYELDTLSLPFTVLEADMKEVLSSRADYLSASRQVDLAGAKVRVARSKFNPQIVAGIQGIFGTPQLNFTGTPKGYGAAYLQVQVPILMWGERHFTISSVRASERAAVLARQEMSDVIQGQVAAARIDMTQTYEQAHLATENVKVATDNLELNTFSYSEGKLPILDVMQSQLSWIQSFTNMVNSTYKYMVSVIDYRRAIGKNTEGIN